MKKILLLVFLFVLGKMSYSQGYPLMQALGSDSTIVVSKGALQSRIIPIVITDTNSANAQRVKNYPGAQLYTTNGDFYIRNSNATKWVLVSSGSSGSVNIYTADGTLTGNRTLTGSSNNLTFTGLNKFTVNTGDTTSFNTNTFNVKGVGGVFNVEGTAAGTTSSLTLKTASDGNWTISTGQVNFNSGDLRFYDNDNGANRMIIKPSGNVGIGTETPDSLLTVNGGAYIGGGIRAPGLPSALGTKALRINAQGQISVADTTVGGGTVTSVATNDGSGITGGPITVSGTLAIDTTNIIATKASVAGGLAGKLNISDTASMLSPYLRKADTTAMLAPYLRAIDTASLSNRINLKLNISDTASMLGNYLNNVGYGLSKVGQVASADSATLSAYYLRRKDSLTTTNPLGYVTKKVLADTAAAIRSSSASGFVPYTGATQNVDLGQFGLKTKYVEFDTSSQAVTDRRLQWSNDDGTLQFGMTNGSAITQRVGLEQFARVKNVDAVQINKGQVVYLYGASGDRASVKLADNRADSTSSKTLGVAAEDIAVNGVGLVGTFGTVGKLNNLTTFSPGDIVYLDSISGQLTNVKPIAPYNMVFIGVVERNNAGNGLLFTNVQNGYELEELHNVLITSPVPNKSILIYDSVRRVWVDTTVAASGIAVTQVNTNSATGITGGPITTTGTIAADTLILSTRAWRQKGVDSLQANINLKLNISDTASMLSPYLRKADTTAMLVNYVNNVGYGLSKVGQVVSADSATLSNYYLRRKDSLTSTNLLGYVTRKVLADTAAAIRSADAGGTVTSVATNNGTGITGGTITTSGTLAIDTTVISTRAWRQKGIDSVAALINNNISGTTNYIPRFSSANTIDNSIMRESGTRIGINTSPFYNLDILETGSATIGAGTTTNKIVLTGTDNGGSISTTNTTYISFSPFQTEAMRITSSGVVNMGANFTNNSNKLNVGGSATIGYSTNVVAPTNGLSINGSVGIGLNGVSTDSALSVLNGAYFQRGVRMSGLPTAPGTKSIRVDANGTLSVSDTLANGVSGSGTPNYIPKFTSSSAIGNSVIYESGGNIGIGTTTPTTKLDVVISSGPYNSRFYNSSTSTSEYNVLLFSQGASGSATGYLGTGGSAVGGAFANNFVIGTQSNNALVLSTNDFERLRISSTGNVGIGTSSPSNKLDVNGNINVPSTNFFRYDGDNGLIGSGTSITGGTATQLGIRAANEILFATNGANERMRLDASGNLGLGVTPSAWGVTALQGPSSFSIANAGTNGMNLLSNAYYGSAWTYTSSGAATWYQKISGEHRWYTAPSGTAGNAITFTQAMTLDASGNLGIGLTSPGVRLHAEATNSNVAIINVIGTAPNYIFDVRDDGVSKFRVDPSGNVGIGTNAPSSILEIKGSTPFITINDGSATSAHGIQFDGGGGVRGGLTVNYSNGEQNLFAGIAGNTYYQTFSLNGSERMRITSDGEVYIAGTTDQGAYNLQVNGTGVWGAGAYVDGSDSSVKKNILPLGSSLDLIKQMNPVTFEYQPFYSKDTTTQTGFIAQELQQVLADKIYKNGVVKEGGRYLGVAYQHLIPLLVKAIQELEAQVQELKTQLNNK